ncbi:MAG: Pycsar system effector family protein [Bacteroidota bacterium]
MNQAEIAEKCIQFVRKLLTDSLSEDFQYHNLEHTLSVKYYCEAFGKAMEVSEQELFRLRIAALFHDTGYTRTYEQHEQASQDIARETLAPMGLEETEINAICQLIEATILFRPPSNLLEQIIKDADLNNVGSEAFQASSNKLRHEWKVFLKEEYDEEGWAKNTLQFLQEHQFYTPVAQDKFGQHKKRNLKKLEKQLKKIMKAKEKEAKKKEGGPITNSRTAQMMFKTSLRNHIDLTNIADNKANMMLSINAIVISITMPLLASNIEGNAFLLIPTSILLITSVLSIIYATLATRPIRMNGMTNLENVRQGKSNLFFFGNFFKMSNDSYHQGIQEVVENNDLLEHTIVNDLFFLGKALGEKYNQLRICYSVFMVGITLTVIAFAVSFFYAQSL